MIPQTLTPAYQAPPQANAPGGRSASARNDRPETGAPEAFTLGDAPAAPDPDKAVTLPQIGLVQPPADTSAADVPITASTQAPFEHGAPLAGTTARLATGQDAGQTDADVLLPKALHADSPASPAAHAASARPATAALAQAETDLPAHDATRTAAPGQGSATAAQTAAPPDPAAAARAPHPSSAEHAVRTSGLAGSAARSLSERGNRSADQAASPHTPTTPQSGPADIADPATAATATQTDAPGAGLDNGGEPEPFARDADLNRIESNRADGPRTDPSRAEIARAAGNQLVEAVRHGPNGTTEVALNPEELGRVRLGLTTLDGVLHVSIMADRPETQDMLRRHIGLLQTDFRALGYTDVAFDFGPGGEQPPRPPDPAPINATDIGLAESVAVTSESASPRPIDPARLTPTATRLDLRV